MKILHVIRDLSVDTGGPVRAIQGLSEAQAKLGHDVAILTTDIGEVTARPVGVELVTARARARRWAWSPEIFDLIRARLPVSDVVHLHMVWDYPVLAAAREASRRRIPYILRPCGQFSTWSMSQSRLKKRIYLRALAGPLLHANAYHFTTDAEQTNSAAMTTSRRTFVIPNGVAVPSDADLPDRAAFSRRFPRAMGRRIVLYLGRLHPQKQPEMAIEAFARCGADDQTLLVLAGPGRDDYVSSLRVLSNRLGITDRVLFTNRLIGPAVQEAYRAAEVFVLPSKHESFGIAAVEAMAFGCATLIGDNLDLAAELKEAGAVMTTPLDVAKMSAALSVLLGDPTLRARLATSGRALVQRRFAWEPIARATVEQYQALRSA